MGSKVHAVSEWSVIDWQAIFLCNMFNYWKYSCFLFCTFVSLRDATFAIKLTNFNFNYKVKVRYKVKANSAFHPCGVGKWVPASAGKAKAGMVHSDSGWTRGVLVKLWDPLRTRAIPERLRGAFTTRRYTNPRLPLPLPLTLPAAKKTLFT